MERFVRDSKLPSPILDAHRLAGIGDHVKVSGVAVLLSLRSPFTIARTVSFVVVDPVQLGSFWSRSHIVDKVYEPVLRVVPTTTNLNTSTAVVFIALIVGVITTLSRLAPDAVDFVFLIFSVITSIAMFEIAWSWHFAIVTATRYGSASS